MPNELGDPLVVIIAAIVAATIAAMELARTKGQQLLAWAVIILAVAVLIDRL